MNTHRGAPFASNRMAEELDYDETIIKGSSGFVPVRDVTICTWGHDTQRRKPPPLQKTR